MLLVLPTLLLVTGCGRSHPDDSTPPPTLHSPSPQHHFTPDELRARNAETTLLTLAERLNEPGRALSHLADIQIPEVELHALPSGKPTRFNAVTWRQQVDDWNASGWEIHSLEYTPQGPIDSNPVTLDLHLTLRAPGGSTHERTATATITWGDTQSGIVRLALRPSPRPTPGK